MQTYKMCNLILYLVQNIMQKMIENVLLGYVHTWRLF